jgi:hypothetical protein
MTLGRNTRFPCARPRLNPQRNKVEYDMRRRSGTAQLPVRVKTGTIQSEQFWTTSPR